MSIALRGQAHPPPAQVLLPDPFRWTAQLVIAFGECRAGSRPWSQIWPLLELPVIDHLWSQRRDRHRDRLELVKLIGQQPLPDQWEMVALVREGTAFRAVAVRVAAASRITGGHHGPPGPRLMPVHFVEAHPQPQAWLATALHLL